MSGRKLRLNEVKDRFGKLNQVIVIKVKAQWLSGIKLRLNEFKDKFDKFNQVIVIKLKAQWLSGLKLRLNELGINKKIQSIYCSIFKSAVVEWSQTASY